MAEFFLELFSEEIPARMQEHDGYRGLRRICDTAIAALSPQEAQYYVGPRRIAVKLLVSEETPGEVIEARGPRDSAPEAALAGFLGKYGAKPEELIVEGGYFWLRRAERPIPAKDFLKSVLEQKLPELPWPKSMRWGSGGDFTWVRPLRSIVCLLDGEVIPFTLGPITAGNETHGHRVHGPGPFAVSSAAVWEEKLREHRVIANQDERRKIIAEGMTEKAAALGLTVAPDDALLDEVTGLVEWPVPLIGKIDAAFMDLPPEVRELSMKINQKYFALRDAEGKPAPYFAFVANLDAEDGGKAIIAGNERVLRARLSDARHFWDLDRKTQLRELLPKLEKITFHAKIGTQRERCERIADLAKRIASKFTNEFTHFDLVSDAEWAGRLSKADLVTGMVGEFPELQGIMGGYYAAQDKWQRDIPNAIRSHYQPKGPNDNVPQGLLPSIVAISDKIDTLVEFFKIDEVPTGSGDPYALRRAALGVSRIILENKLDFSLEGIIEDERVFGFIVERLRIKLRGEGQRFDVLAAVFASSRTKNLLHMMWLVQTITSFFTTASGGNLLSAYRRATNILKAEDAKDGPHTGLPNPDLYVEDAETKLSDRLSSLGTKAVAAIGTARYGEATESLSFLSFFVDDFFLKVTVNAPEPELRRNRLRLLSRFVGAVRQVADFSKIEG